MKEKTLQHIAIIPDGNRRWAKTKGKMAIEGHRYAVEHTLPALYDHMLEIKIPVCTFWALSPENFTKRSKFEVDHLLNLLHIFLNERLEDMHSKNIKILTIGDIDKLPENTRSRISEAIEKTKKNTGLVFVFALNYGGRDEIIRAVQNLSETAITKDSLTAALDTSGIPDPDLIIRTGGEHRTSGFLLWQSEYAEYVFSEKLFPDFSPDDLDGAIEEYYQRKRRFGS